MDEDLDQKPEDPDPVENKIGAGVVIPGVLRVLVFSEPCSARGELLALRQAPALRKIPWNPAKNPVESPGASHGITRRIRDSIKDPLEGRIP